MHAIVLLVGQTVTTNPQRTVNINGDQNITANFESFANNIQYSLVNLTFPCAATISTERSYNEYKFI